MRYLFTTITALLFFLMLVGILRAGYEQPSYLDGCRSSNGQFEITAQLVQSGKTSHGPNHWQFTWKDLKTGEAKTFPAAGVQGGQSRGQLYIAPDGETFALWNHITMFWQEKSHMHASSHADVLPGNHDDVEAYRSQPIFQKRLIIYRKDGSILKSLDLKDLLTADDWHHVLPVFNRIHWLQPFDDLNFKATPRTAYAYTRVSPDYTVLEFQVGDRKQPRIVRVSLVDGSIFPTDHKFTNAAKTPVRAYRGEDHLPHHSGEWLEAYQPSLDPVREPGTYQTTTIEKRFPSDKAPRQPEFKVGEVKQWVDGLTKGDTPGWLPSYGKKPDEAGRLLFTDVEQNTLYTLFPDGKKNVVRVGTSRGKIHDKRTFIGLINGALAAWNPITDEPPKVLLSAGPDGRKLSLNDLIVSQRGLIYFTTLKDPEKGRLSVLDPRSGKVTVLFDGEEIPELANPNGIALDRSERFLYVGISNYKNKKHSGIYAFAIQGDGSIDLEAGMAKPRIAVQSPDGIVVDRANNIYFTRGNLLHVYTPYASPLAKIKIPDSSGTNLCFGGNDRFHRTLYFTTWNGVYSVETPIGK